MRAVFISILLCIVTIVIGCVRPIVQTHLECSTETRGRYRFVFDDDGALDMRLDIEHYLKALDRERRLDELIELYVLNEKEPYISANRVPENSLCYKMAIIKMIDILCTKSRCYENKYDNETVFAYSITLRDCAYRS